MLVYCQIVIKSWNYKELEMKVFRFKEAIVYIKKCLLFNKLKSCS